MNDAFEDPRPDAELLADVAGGDWDSLGLLYGRHAPWLLLRLSHRCADRDLVEEVVQDTFVNVWRSAGSYRGGGPVSAWIWRIGVRRLLDRLRQRKRWSRTGWVWQSAEEPSAEEQVLAGVEHGDLAGALERLSPELRAVLQATVLDGLTTREAARLLGIPSGTVKTRAMRARAQLRQELT
jgi:RNA polymerase sigma-70 factor (ECF subfamily)